MRSARLRFIVAGLIAVVLTEQSAVAQVIRADCQPHVGAISRLSFAHEKHRLWYQRFWNGKCQGLSQSLLGDACSESEPGWNQAVADLVRQAPADKKAETLARVCRLGELIGYEWAKDNNVRCIHTFGSNSLGTLNGLLKSGGDVLGRLTRVETQARSMCRTLSAPVARG